MKQLIRLLIMSLLVVVVMAVKANAAPQAKKGEGAWWEKNVGRLTAAEEPLVARAEEVFKRMVAAADSSSAHHPRLLVLKENRDPWAAAIPDGTVLLSRGALSICYKGVEPGKGDGRLAFILGHELAHQAKDDFWHAEAMGALKAFTGGRDEKDAQVVSSYIEDTSDHGPTPQAKAVAKVKELQADDYGIVFMAMAGFDPRSVIDGNGANFIEEFVSQVTGKTAYEDAEHPSAAQRAVFLRARLERVADEVDLFKIGVRYYQQGRYEEAIPFFDRFRARFPSREVFNNLGVSWYQIALQHLAGCDSSHAFRYKLPTMLDTETLASVTRSKGGVCRESADFRQFIGEAVKYLEIAAAKDSLYLPARLNLASACLLAGDAVRAMAASEEALRIMPSSPDGTMLRALALYEFGKTNGVDTAQKAREILAPLAVDSSLRREALYNLASIEKDRGDSQAQRIHLEAFLALEKTGPYALRAAVRLGKAVPPPPVGAAAQYLPSPIPIGDVSGATVQTLKSMAKREVVVGGEKAFLYRSEGKLALAFDDGGQEIVELVETQQIQPGLLDAFLKTHGIPRKSVLTPTGQTLIYKQFSADETGGLIRNIVFFAPKGGI